MPRPSASRAPASADVLVDSQGRTLYLFEKDPARRARAPARAPPRGRRCASSGKPTAGTGVKASLLGTTKRSDGKPQVTYNGHPLYLFEGDQKPGDTSGQGVDAFGAGWFVLSRPATRSPTASDGQRHSGYSARAPAVAWERHDAPLAAYALGASRSPARPPSTCSSTRPLPRGPLDRTAVPRQRGRLRVAAIAGLALRPDAAARRAGGRRDLRASRSAGLVVSYGDGLFGWQEAGFRPPVALTVIAEVCAVGSSSPPGSPRRPLGGEGDDRGHERAAAGRALDPELPVEHGKPVRQPEKTAPAAPGASDAVVAHLDVEGAVLDADRGASGASVFGDVGERLGDDRNRRSPRPPRGPGPPTRRCRPAPASATPARPLPRGARPA